MYVQVYSACHYHCTIISVNPPPPLQPEQVFSGKDAALLAIPQFCFPDIDQWKPTKSYKSESFSFVLTDMMGGRRFGYCRRLLVRLNACDRQLV